jgi:hypothetical protein
MRGWLPWQLGTVKRRWWTGLAPMDARSASVLVKRTAGWGRGYATGSAGPGGWPRLFWRAHRIGHVQWQRHHEGGGRAGKQPHELELIGFNPGGQEGSSFLWHSLGCPGSRQATSRRRTPRLRPGCARRMPRMRHAPHAGLRPVERF